MKNRGSITIIALIIFLALTVMGAAAIEISRAESLISNYYYKSEQAQQAADAGVDWAIERIYNQLLDCSDDEDLPNSFPSANPELPVGEVKIKNIRILSQQANQDEGNYCAYSFECLGSYQKAYRHVKAIVEYTFAGGYMDSGDFLPRDYLDRGIISSYQIIAE